MELPASIKATGLVELMLPAHACRLADTGLQGWIVCAIEPTREGSDLLVAPPDEDRSTSSALLRIRQDPVNPVLVGDRITIDCTLDARFIFPAAHA